MWLTNDMLENAYFESTRMKRSVLGFRTVVITGKTLKITHVMLCIRHLCLGLGISGVELNRSLEILLVKKLKLTWLEMTGTWLEALKAERIMASSEVETLTETGNFLDHRNRKKSTINFKLYYFESKMYSCSLLLMRKVSTKLHGK